jgi:hypothetical protein
MLSDVKSFGEQYLAKTKFEIVNVIAKVQDSLTKTSSSLVLNTSDLLQELLDDASDFAQ